MGFSSGGFTRGSGFVIRPELYSGLFATLGYQINPYVQLSGGFGFGLDAYGGFVTLEYELIHQIKIGLQCSTIILVLSVLKD